MTENQLELDDLTPLDREVISLLADSRLTLTPAVMSENLDRNRTSVAHTLSKLKLTPAVEQTERGYYRATDRAKELYKEILNDRL